jgi:hypothetical protein
MIGFNPQSKNVKVIISTDKTKNYYYFKNNILTAIMFSNKDSLYFKYKNNLLVKINQFENGKFTGEANYIYNDKNERIDLTYSKDYNDYYQNYSTEIPYVNKYNLLEKDFVYIDAILSSVKNGKSYYLNKKLKRTHSLSFKLDVDVTLSNSNISPFIFGSTIKNLKLSVKDNYLKEIYAVLMYNSGRKRIVYKKYYTYDKNGRLKSTKTIDVTNNKVENKETIEYSEW